MKKKLFVSLVIVLAWMTSSTIVYANSANSSQVVPIELPVEFQGKINSSVRMVKNTGEVKILYPNLWGLITE